MATKKPKTSKGGKTTTSKPKTAAKTVSKPDSEAPKTNTVEKKSTKTEKVVAKAEKVEKAEKTEKKETIVSENKKSLLSGFFAKKYEGSESILSIFKCPKFYGSLLGEVIGTMLVTLLLFAFFLMGIQNITSSILILVAVFVGVYAFSGAFLNPIVTVGAMATRRISVIRGMMYIVAQIVGAWLAWLIFSAFHNAGGDTAYDLPELAVSEISENGQFWVFALVELLGAFILALFYARALKYKRSAFTFATTVAGGFGIAVMVGFVISAAFFGTQNNFVYNPAAALMLKIFPTAGDDFGQIFGGIMQALSVYVLFPAVGGVLGFYLSDFTGKLVGEE